jgi:phosphate transport system substrate-binding protein
MSWCHGVRTLEPFMVRTSWLLLLPLLFLGCSAAPGKTIRLTGASTIAPLASEIGKAFEAAHPGVRVDVQTGGSARGVLDTRGGNNELGMVSRPLKEDEKDLHAFPLALDGITVIVHAKNPVTALPREQIVAIFTGKITNWKEVGGPDAKITVVNKEEGRSTLELFCSYFDLKNSAIKAHAVIGDNKQGIKTVVASVHAIGYVSVGTAEYEAGQGVPIKLLPIDGVVASSANIANGTFPLARPLNLVAKSPPEGVVKEFLDFATSPQAHPLIRETGFVPLRP